MISKLFITILGFILIVTSIFIWKNNEVKINSFESCLQAGYPIMESYPRKCQTEQGDVFTEIIDNKKDLIEVQSIEIESGKLLVYGKARGYWFFEGDFPIRLETTNQEVLGYGIASSLDEWMTENFVDFKGEIDFSTTTNNLQTNLILMRDNPSGLPENDDQLIIPVTINLD